MAEISHGDQVDASALKKPRVKAVLGTLPQLEQGSRLRQIFQCHSQTLFDGFFRDLDQLMLDGLSFHWPNNVQSNRGTNYAAKMQKHEKPKSFLAGQSQIPHHHAKRGSQVTERNPTDGAGKYSLRCRQQGLALCPAGSVGHMIGGERIANLIQFLETLRFGMPHIDQRQSRASDLPQTGGQPFLEFAAIPDLTVLPRRFKATRVRKSPRRER